MISSVNDRISTNIKPTYCQRTLQREAKLLRDMNMTRVVAIGIGADVGRTELYSIASYPHELSVIMAPDFSNLTATNVENHVMRAICGKY